MGISLWTGNGHELLHVTPPPAFPELSQPLHNFQLLLLGSGINITSQGRAEGVMLEQGLISGMMQGWQLDLRCENGGFFFFASQGFGSGEVLELSLWQVFGQTLPALSQQRFESSGPFPEVPIPNLHLGSFGRTHFSHLVAFRRILGWWLNSIPCLPFPQWENRVTELRDDDVKHFPTGNADPTWLQE